MAELIIGLYLFGVSYAAGWLGLPNRRLGAWADAILWPITWPLGKIFRRI